MIQNHPDRPANQEAEIEITPEMIEAGVERFNDLKDDAGSAYAVREIFLAMVRERASCRSGSSY
jgi:hypothetical protein